MRITDIVYYIETDDEAEVTVSDGRHAVLCYAYPADSMRVGQEIHSLDGLFCEDIVRCEDEEEQAVKLPSSYYAYSLTARVIDRRTVALGDLSITLDTPVPGDIVPGEIVRFSVLRLDC